ncbi:MAG: hypothetical protein ACQETQ_13800 [Spirochaetota bacterium]
MPNDDKRKTDGKQNHWDTFGAEGQDFRFMGRHNGAFPLQHVSGVFIGVAGHGDAAAAIRDLSVFFEDARGKAMLILLDR